MDSNIQMSINIMLVLDTYQQITLFLKFHTYCAATAAASKKLLLDMDWMTETNRL